MDAPLLTAIASGALRAAWGAEPPRTNQSQLREPNHFTEVAQRYAALLHRLHPERASEQGLRSYDALSAPTSAQEIQRTVRGAPSAPAGAFVRGRPRSQPGVLTSLFSKCVQTTLLERTTLELNAINEDGLEPPQRADLAAMRFDASLRLFRTRRLHEWQTDPFFYLAPGYRGILFLNAMLGRIPRAELALLPRLRCAIGRARAGARGRPHG